MSLKRTLQWLLLAATAVLMIDGVAPASVNGEGHDQTHSTFFHWVAIPTDLTPTYGAFRPSPLMTWYGA